jgi:hypothetical protein
MSDHPQQTVGFCPTHFPHKPVNLTVCDKHWLTELAVAAMAARVPILPLMGDAKQEICCLSGSQRRQVTSITPACEEFSIRPYWSAVLLAHHFEE